MIKRELYMSRIRPFIGGELIKVMTGMRRSGKSVMLELIQHELLVSGVKPEQFISINFEDLRYTHLLTAKPCTMKLSEERRISTEKSIYSLMRFKKSRTGKSALTHSALRWTATFISPVLTQSFYLASLPLILEDGMWNLSFIHFLSLNLWNCIVPSSLRTLLPRDFRIIYYPAGCHISVIFATRMSRPANT